MTVSEQTVPKKNAKVPYSFQRYPMELFGDPSNHLHKPSIKVNSEDEEESALAQGYSDNPPAIQASVAVPMLTTQAGVQASYEAVKKELDAKTAEFNMKYAKLQLKHDALESQVGSLTEKNAELQAEYAKLTADLNQATEPKQEADPFEKMPQDESTQRSRARR